MDNIVDELIEERTIGTKVGQSTDYLAALLEDVVDSGQELGAIRDTLMTLLFAGRDSTQNAISWAMYEILRKPKWVRLMQEEADNAAKTFEPGQTIPSYSQMHVRDSFLSLSSSSHRQLADDLVTVVSYHHGGVL